MKKILVLLGATLLAVGASVTAASATSGKASANADACVLLPDSKSSVRWETQDRRFLAAAFKAGGISNTIVNAEGDAQKQRSQARSVPYQWREGDPARQPRLGFRSCHREGGDRRWRQGDRLRPAHAQRRRVVLRLVRQRPGRQARGPGHRQRPQGAEEDRYGCCRCSAERLADRQQRDALQAGIRRRAEPVLQGRAP